VHAPAERERAAELGGDQQGQSVLLGFQNIGGTLEDLGALTGRTSVPDAGIETRPRRGYGPVHVRGGTQNGRSERVPKWRGCIRSPARRQCWAANGQ
jgi:hypothetical protein